MYFIRLLTQSLTGLRFASSGALNQAPSRQSHDLISLNSPRSSTSSNFDYLSDSTYYSDKLDYSSSSDESFEDIKPKKNKKTMKKNAVEKQNYNHSQGLSLIIRGTKHVKAILSLTKSKKRAHLRMPLLFITTLDGYRLSRTKRSLSNLAAHAKKRSQSIQFGLLLEQEFMESYAQSKVWPRLLRRMRTRFERVTKMGLKAVIYEGPNVPIGLKTAVENAGLYGIHENDVKDLSQDIDNYNAKVKVARKMYLRYSLKKRFGVTEDRLFTIHFRRKPDINHIVAIKKAAKWTKRPIVDLETCLFSPELQTSETQPVDSDGS